MCHTALKLRPTVSKQRSQLSFLFNEYLADINASQNFKKRENQNKTPKSSTPTQQKASGNRRQQEARLLTSFGQQLE